MTVVRITLLKRRKGMSMAEFVDYYETYHRRIGERVLGGYATRYVRRYLTPHNREECENDPDVVMEIHFPDMATHDACFAAMTDPAIRAEITADEERVFDRSRIHAFTVEERDSVLPPVSAI